MIEVLTSSTPNATKVPIALEELGQPYSVHRVDLTRGSAAVPEFVAISSDAKMPSVRRVLGRCGS